MSLKGRIAMAKGEVDCEGYNESLANLNIRHIEDLTRLYPRLAEPLPSNPCCSESSISKASTVVEVSLGREIDKGAEGFWSKITSAARFVCMSVTFGGTLNRVVVGLSRNNHGSSIERIDVAKQGTLIMSIDYYTHLIGRLVGVHSLTQPSCDFCMRITSWSGVVTFETGTLGVVRFLQPGLCRRNANSFLQLRRSYKVPPFLSLLL